MSGFTLPAIDDEEEHTLILDSRQHYYKVD